MSIRLLFVRVVILIALATWPNLSGAATLDRIKERGSVQCGVNRTGQGLSTVNAAGEWVGFFVDFCRAVPAATLKGASPVWIVEMNQLSALHGTSGGQRIILCATTH